MSVGGMPLTSYDDDEDFKSVDANEFGEGSPLKNKMQDKLPDSTKLNMEASKPSKQIVKHRKSDALLIGTDFNSDTISPGLPDLKKPELPKVDVPKI